MSTASDLRLATHLADLVARLSLSAFETGDFEVEHKSDGSPVTTADTEIELALRDELARERPEDHIVGEEFGGDPGTGRCWYLDPIDGTTNFISGSDAWGSLISLTHGGTVLTAVVDIPKRGQRFWATRGAGAFADGNRLRVSRTRCLAEASICVGSPDDLARPVSDGQPGSWAQRCQQAHPYLGGESMLAVACGEADIAIGSGGGPWDYAPFVLLVEEAGGATSDLLGRPRFDGGALLATNGMLQGEGLEALGAESPERQTDWRKRPVVTEGETAE